MNGVSWDTKFKYTLIILWQLMNPTVDWITEWHWNSLPGENAL